MPFTQMMYPPFLAQLIKSERFETVTVDDGFETEANPTGLSLIESDPPFELDVELDVEEELVEPEDVLPEEEPVEPEDVLPEEVVPEEEPAAVLM